MRTVYVQRVGVYLNKIEGLIGQRLWNEEI